MSSSSESEDNLSSDEDINDFEDAVSLSQSCKYFNDNIYVKYVYLVYVFS